MNKENSSLLYKAFHSLFTDGWRVFVFKVHRRLHKKEEYKLWIQQNEGRQEMTEKFSYLPLISVVVPVYNVDPKMLKACIESVRNQTYRNWELCLVDDCSTQESVRRTLRAYEEQENIRICYREENGHISRATNDGIAMAKGEFAAFLDCDDVLAENALYEVVNLLNQDRSYDFIYSDEDKMSEDGSVRRNPFFKPDWSPDTFMSLMYTCHLGVYRKRLLDELGGVRVGFEGAQDYDLVLRLMERTNRIGHVPKILYHWREREESTANDISAKPYVLEATKRAKTEALERRGAQGHLEYLPDIAMFRVVYDVTDHPMVSIIIPSKDNPDILEQCLTSICRETAYDRYEIVVVDNGSSGENHERYETLCRSVKAKYCYEPMEFNFSRMCNIGAKHADGEYLLFLNDDIRVEGSEWLSRMLGHAQQPHTGAVGCKLLYPDTSLIQHVGVVNFPVGPGHAFLKFNDNLNCYWGRNKLEYNYSAVTGACLMTNRQKFEQAGGFPEELPVAYNDMDLCFRLLELGYYNVVRTDVRLYHYESLSRGYDDATPEKRMRQKREMERLYDRHPKFRGYDPCYNPNLIGNTDTFELNVMHVQGVRTPVPDSSEWTESDDLCCMIDELADHATVRISGWAFDARKKKDGRVRIVLKDSAGKRYAVKTEKNFRPDVAGNSGNRNLALAGFETMFDKSGLPAGTYRLYLNLKNMGHEIGEITVL